MNKPNNYDTTQVGPFKKIQLGGHNAIIKEVVETKSSGGRDMIVVYIDFDATDAQPGYFADLYRNDTREKKKWPYQAVHYIVTTDLEGNTSRAFKSFITSFEKSNGCTVQWGDRFAVQFKNRSIGVVYGEEESEWNDNISTKPRIRYFCDIAEALSQAIPEKKTLSGIPAASAAAQSEDWMSIPDGADDGLPFR